jgi:hypothetical protein
MILGGVVGCGYGERGIRRRKLLGMRLLGIIPVGDLAEGAGRKEGVGVGDLLTGVCWRKRPVGRSRHDGRKEEFGGGDFA